MILNEKEMATVQAVFFDLMSNFTDRKLNQFIGSETIDAMHALYHKLYMREWLELTGKTYEELTDEDQVEFFHWRWDA